MRRSVFQAVLVALAVLALAVPAAQAQDETGWSIRLNGMWTIPNTDSVNTGHPLVQVETTTGETFGLALSGEYRFSERAGLEIGVQAGYDVQVDYTVRDKMSGEILGDDLDANPSDDVRFTLVDAALNIYLASRGVDLYVGPVIGFITYTDSEVRLGDDDPVFTISNDGDFAWGGVIGLDIPFVDSPWFVTSSIKYLVSSHDAMVSTSGPIATPYAGQGSAEIDFDPWIFRFGLGYKF